MEDLDYKCKLSNNRIQYICYKENGEAHMEETYIDERIPKLFMLVLRSSVEDLANKGYKKIVQTVPTSDWQQYLQKDKWKLRKTLANPEFSIIECDLSEAIGCISRGLGFTANTK